MVALPPPLFNAIYAGGQRRFEISGSFPDVEGSPLGGSSLLLPPHPDRTAVEMTIRPIRKLEHRCLFTCTSSGEDGNLLKGRIPRDRLQNAYRIEEKRKARMKNACITFYGKAGGIEHGAW
jgi:hypothetical protein